VQVFNPVWIDEFSPPEMATRWLASLQAATPIGVMIGYILGG
jgi:hypothetical protein